MGYFSNLVLDIEDALAQGATVKQISGQFDISEADVENYIEQLDQADRDPVYYGA